MFLLSTKIQDELRVVERADMASLGTDVLAEYFVRLKRAKPNLALQPNEKILRLQGLTEGEKPTVAGLLLLGEYPQAYFPQLSVTAMVVDGTEFGAVGLGGERFIDNQRIEGTLMQMLEGTLAFIRRNTRVSTIIDGDGRRADHPEYPVVAVREIVLNALIHRDYSIHTDHSPIRVILYRDRLEVENPGGLYGRITVDELGKMAADTRNPFIAGGLEVLLGTENRFSGIPTILAEMEQAQLAPPLFESRRGVFRVTLYNKRLDSLQNGIGMLPEPMRQILDYCIQPRGRKDIARLLGIETPSYVVVKYLRPLVEMGKLQLTLPSAPKSKNQKYVTVREEE